MLSRSWRKIGRECQSMWLRNTIEARLRRRLDTYFVLHGRWWQHSRGRMQRLASARTFREGLSRYALASTFLMSVVWEESAANCTLWTDELGEHPVLTKIAIQHIVEQVNAAIDDMAF